MDARQIRYFLAASDSMNFTRAAERCGVALTTLTRSIKALETEVGGSLFRRERQVISLTDLGRLMLQHLAAAQRNMDAAHEAADRYAKLAGSLKIGVLTTMPSGALIAYLRNIHEVGPELELTIWESHCTELAEALIANEIDLAIMSLPDYGDALQARPLLREPYSVAFPAGHRFGAMDAVPLREIDGEPYVKRLHCEFPDNFEKLGIDVPYTSLDVRYVSEREDWIQAMVQAGLGIAVMPAYLPLLPDLQMRPLVEPAVCRTISLVTVAGRTHSRPVQLAVDVAENTAWTPC